MASINPVQVYNNSHFSVLNHPDLISIKSSRSENEAQSQFDVETEPSSAVNIVPSNGIINSNESASLHSRRTSSFICKGENKLQGILLQGGGGLPLPLSDLRFVVPRSRGYPPSKCLLLILSPKYPSVVDEEKEADWCSKNWHVRPPKR